MRKVMQGDRQMIDNRSNCGQLTKTDGMEERTTSSGMWIVAG